MVLKDVCVCVCVVLEYSDVVSPYKVRCKLL